MLNSNFLELFYQLAFSKVGVAAAAASGAAGDSIAAFVEGLGDEAFEDEPKPPKARRRAKAE